MRILLAVYDDLYREILGVLLHRLGDHVQVSEAADLPALLAKASGSSPRLVVVDASLLAAADDQPLREVVARCPGGSVVVLGERIDTAASGSYLRAGARGHVSKSMGCRAMLDAFHLILAGEPYLAGGAVVASAGETDEAMAIGLTPRQGQVLSLLTEGHPNKVIAWRLGIREITVKAHLGGVYRKLGVRNRAHAVRTTIDLGLESAGDGSRPRVEALSPVA